jgi:hypothetical protein
MTRFKTQYRNFANSKVPNSRTIKIRPHTYGGNGACYLIKEQLSAMKCSSVLSDLK